jgi:hypothetical protein
LYGYQIYLHHTSAPDHTGRCARTILLFKDFFKICGKTNKEVRKEGRAERRLQNERKNERKPEMQRKIKKLRQTE